MKFRVVAGVRRRQAEETARQVQLSMMAASGLNKSLQARLERLDGMTHAYVRFQTVVELGNRFETVIELGSACCHWGMLPLEYAVRCVLSLGRAVTRVVTIA